MSDYKEHVGYVRPPRYCFVCMEKTDRVYYIGRVPVVSCSYKHGDMTLKGQTIGPRKDGKK